MIDLMIEDIKGNSSVESITKKPKQVVAVQCPCVALYCHFQKSKKSLLTCCSLSLFPCSLERDAYLVAILVLVGCSIIKS